MCGGGNHADDEEGWLQPETKVEKAQWLCLFGGTIDPKTSNPQSTGHYVDFHSNDLLLGTGEAQWTAWKVYLHGGEAFLQEGISHDGAKHSYLKHNVAIFSPEPGDTVTIRVGRGKAVGFSGDPPVPVYPPGFEVQMRVNDGEWGSLTPENQPLLPRGGEGMQVFVGLDDSEAEVADVTLMEDPVAVEHRIELDRAIRAGECPCTGYVCMRPKAFCCFGDATCKVCGRKSRRECAVQQESATAQADCSNRKSSDMALLVRHLSTTNDAKRQARRGSMPQIASNSGQGQVRRGSMPQGKNSKQSRRASTAF